VYPELEQYLQSLSDEVDRIEESRRAQLQRLAQYITEVIADHRTAKLTFICTHNSRRSHLCQVWARVLAAYRGIEQLETYSGGTEATALNRRAAQAMERAGLRVENPGGQNPRYRISYTEDQDPLICFSKTFDDPANPDRNFAAVMTCTDADENCPFVPGAEQRFSIPYVDPKESDGTDRETEVYDERCRQIAREMHYLISQIG
jgi:protein-tyrosine-phosphatase